MTLLGWMAVFLGIVLAWAIYTHHAWEDFFISFRAAQNLAQGHGLVYQVGERVHTFTSPLHTLLLALLSYVVGPEKDAIAALWLYRILGALALGGVAYLTDHVGKRQGWHVSLRIVTILLIAADAKTIDFTVNGMETPLFLVFLALHLHGLFVTRSPRTLGLAWAGMMWTRPDAFVFIGASLTAALIFPQSSGGSRRLIRPAIIAGAFAVLLYVPWLVWAQRYYGSFVPHTIIAKGLDLEGTGIVGGLHRLAAAGRAMVRDGDMLNHVFAASYTRGWDWGFPFPLSWRVAASVPWLYWLCPWARPFGRATGLTLFIASFYGAAVPFFPWYAPPYALLGIVTWGAILADLAVLSHAAAAHRTGLRRLLLVSGIMLGGALLALQMTTSFGMARTMRWQQALIEDGNRKPIGLWLKNHARPNDTVFLECVGYIGYYSGLKMEDFPGLTSREVVAARRRLHTNEFSALIAELRPDWIVLRPEEVEELRRTRPELIAATRGAAPPYQSVRIFDQSAAVSAVPAIRGRRYLERDQRFEVFHRRATNSP